MTIPNGEATRLRALPLQLGDKRLGVRRDVPAPGGDGADILRELDFSEAQIKAFADRGVVEL